MAGTLTRCVPQDHVRVDNPWGLTIVTHRALKERLKRAIDNVERKNKRRAVAGRSTWSPERCDGYNCRQIRGSTAWSRHAYAAANDWFDLPLPQVPDIWGPKNAPPRWWAREFTKLGFSWGGNWTSRKDYPHIEWPSNWVPELQPVVVDRFVVTMNKVFNTKRGARRAIKRMQKDHWKQKGEIEKKQVGK